MSTRITNLMTQRGVLTDLTDQIKDWPTDYVLRG